MISLLKQCDDGWLTFIPDSVFETYSRYLKKTVEKNSEFKLYRYCGLYYFDDNSNQMKFSLDLEKLRFSSNGSLNDIFEGLPNSDYSMYSIEKCINKLSKTAYIKCFTETYQNNLMWAHYADSHKGVCIEYDIKRIDEESIIDNFFPVVYSKKRDVFVSEELLIDYFNGEKELDATRDAKGIFLKKADCWKYEKEWRACIMNVDNESASHIEISFPYVSAIYIGARTSQEDIERIKSKVAEFTDKYKCPIELYKMKLNETTYDLETFKL